MKTTPSKTLSFYIHDCSHEIGQGSVTINTINNLNLDINTHVKIYCFTCSPKEKIFPKTGNNVSIIKFPFGKAKPMLLKDLIFHFFSSLNIFLHKSEYSISLGVAAPKAKCHIIHYIHKQWIPIYFSQYKFSLLKLVYKKILYLYNERMERKSFTPNKKYLTVSKFMQDFLISEYKVDPSSVQTIYSGIDTSKYQIINQPKSEILEELRAFHPKLARVDLSRPISLFIGGFQRKGLHLILEKVSKSHQIIVIGNSEKGSPPVDTERFIHIQRTNYINLFYNLCDDFLFPTKYEPFGLVIIEAFATGLPVHTLDKNIGANELLSNNHDFYEYSQSSYLEGYIPKKLSLEQRSQNIANRKELLEKYKWAIAGEKYNKAFNL